jgi:hypothetical protein
MHVCSQQANEIFFFEAIDRLASLEMASEAIS